MTVLNARESVIHTTLQIKASLPETACDFRWNTPKSIANIVNTNRLNPIHNQIDSCIMILLRLYLVVEIKNETPRPYRGSLASCVITRTISREPELCQALS